MPTPEDEPMPSPSNQIFLTVFDRQFHLKELAEIVDRVLTTAEPNPINATVINRPRCLTFMTDPSGMNVPGSIPYAFREGG